MSPKGRIRRKRKYIYVNDTRTLTILLALGGWGHAMRPSNGGVPDWLYNFILAETSRQGSRPRRWRLDTKSRLEFRRWSERNCKIIYTIHFIDWLILKIFLCRVANMGIQFRRRLCRISEVREWFVYLSEYLTLTVWLYLMQTFTKWRLQMVERSALINQRA